MDLKLVNNLSDRHVNNICKYCHSNTHTIEYCDVIICKQCKIQGHPYWRCNSKMIKDVNYYLNIITQLNENNGIKWSELC